MKIESFWQCLRMAANPRAWTPVPQALMHTLERIARRAIHQHLSVARRPLDEFERAKRLETALALMSDYAEGELRPWEKDLRAGGLDQAIDSWITSERDRWLQNQQPDVAALHRWATNAWKGLA